MVGVKGDTVLSVMKLYKSDIAGRFLGMVRGCCELDSDMYTRARILVAAIPGSRALQSNILKQWGGAQ